MIFNDNSWRDRKMSKKPVMLMILDGFGIAPKSEGNAVTLAKKT